MCDTIILIDTNLDLKEWKDVWIYWKRRFQKFRKREKRQEVFDECMKELISK